MDLTTCKAVAERLAEYADGTLAPDETRGLEAHLSACEICRDTFKRLNTMHGLLQYVQAQSEAGAEAAVEAEVAAVTAALNDPEDVPAPVLTGADQFENKWYDYVASAPWWFVSAALHVLAIALVGLLSMDLGARSESDAVVMLTELQKAAELKPADEKKPEPAKALTPKDMPETPPTDKDSTLASEILVTEEMLAHAEVGDHFETNNPDRPDTGGAFGNPDAKIFYSPTGVDDKAGGGGTGGTELADALIGVGGSASKGTGGGWGGGNGTGIGPGEGSGKGSFGNRNAGGRKTMVLRHGGTKAGETAVDKALAWLARHQEADGHWDAVKYGGDPAKHAWAPGNLDVAMTGYAVLAFLGAGHTEKTGKYSSNVAQAIYWLRQIQQPDGALDTNYGHAIAGMALAEASAMARVPETIAAAQKAIDCTAGKGLATHEATSERYGWSYKPPQLLVKGGDLSNSGWTIMFLKSAKVAKLRVSPFLFQGAKNFLDECEHGRDPNDPYSGHHYAYMPQDRDKVTAEGCSAQLTLVGILNRQFMGTKKDELQHAAEWAVKKGGVPSHEGGYRDGLYYIYYGTLVCFQQGGELWKQWNKALLEVLPPTQCAGGDNEGSWDPKGAYSDDWGRVGQTALSALCLEVYYRYEVLKN